jgi:phospholipase C
MAPKSPIQHVVLIIKENHTFDNYFGTFPGANGAHLDRATNPPTDDPIHRHEVWMTRANNPKHSVQYVESDIPAYYQLARRFTLCDNYFSEVAGPSTPNHLMLIAAASPIINNPHQHYRPSPSDMYDIPSLPISLEHARLTWGNYGGYAFEYLRALKGHPGTHTSEHFATDAKHGVLPSVSWVYASESPARSEHPTQNVTDGMQWTLDQIKAIGEGPRWNRTAVFVTWDDWGGWYDHVEPPVIETWNSSMAQRPQDAFPQFNGQPFRYGSRVPCLVISPFAKQGYISHLLHSHVSLVSFCEKTFGLPPLNARDAGASDMLDCFDLTQAPLPFPPL